MNMGFASEGWGALPGRGGVIFPEKGGVAALPTQSEASWEVSEHQMQDSGGHRCM